MTNKETTQATLALFNWFESQSINEADAANICTMVLACIIRQVSTNDSDLRTGMNIATKQIAEILALDE